MDTARAEGVVYAEFVDVAGVSSAATDGPGDSLEMIRGEHAIALANLEAARGAWFGGKVAQHEETARLAAAELTNALQAAAAAAQRAQGATKRGQLRELYAELCALAPPQGYTRGELYRLSSPSGGHADLKRVEALLRGGVDMDGKGERFSEGGSLPLHRACWKNEHGVAKLLLEYGADPDAGDNIGQTALHYAAKSGRLVLVELLLASGASADVVDADGIAPRERAARTAQSGAINGEVIQQIIRLLEQ